MELADLGFCQHGCFLRLCGFWLQLFGGQPGRRGGMGARGLRLCWVARQDVAHDRGMLLPPNPGGVGRLRAAP